jgi:hypothetical protein
LRIQVDHPGGGFISVVDGRTRPMTKSPLKIRT